MPELRANLKFCNVCGSSRIKVVEEKYFDDNGGEYWKVVSTEGGEMQSGFYGIEFPVCDNCLRTLKRGPMSFWGLGF